MSSNDQHPGLIASHAEYIKAAAVSAVGAMTGSEAWTRSGEQQKQHAVEDMKAASADRDPSRDGYGKVEEIAGKVTGCEGMVKEGHESLKD